MCYGRRGQMTEARRQMTVGNEQKTEISVICYLTSVFWNKLMERELLPQIFNIHYLIIKETPCLHLPT
jgi:hypothetical protein